MRSIIVHFVKRFADSIIFKLGVVLVILMGSVGWQEVAAQSITYDNSWGGANLCRGGSVPVSFTTSGTFNSGNVFTVEVSDSTGSFTGTPLVIGTGNPNPNKSFKTITCSLSNIPVGHGYFLRVKSSSPARTSNCSSCIGSPGDPPHWFGVTNIRTLSASFPAISLCQGDYYQITVDISCTSNPIQVLLSDSSGQFGTGSIDVTEGMSITNSSATQLILGVNVPYDIEPSSHYKFRVKIPSDTTFPVATSGYLPVSGIAGFNKISSAVLSGGTLYGEFWRSTCPVPSGDLGEDPTYSIYLSDSSGSFDTSSTALVLTEPQDFALPISGSLPLGRHYRLKVEISSLPGISWKSQDFAIVVPSVQSILPANDSIALGAAIPYFFTTNAKFDTTNTFELQLSDSSGSFGEPLILASKEGRSIERVLARFPFQLLNAGGYRIRLKSSHPSATFLLGGDVSLYAQNAPVKYVCSVDAMKTPDIDLININSNPSDPNDRYTIACSVQLETPGQGYTPPLTNDQYYFTFECYKTQLNQNCNGTGNLLSLDVAGLLAQKGISLQCVAGNTLLIFHYSITHNTHGSTSTNDYETRYIYICPTSPCSTLDIATTGIVGESVSFTHESLNGYNLSVSRNGSQLLNQSAVLGAGNIPVLPPVFQAGTSTFVFQFDPTEPNSDCPSFTCTKSITLCSNSLTVVQSNLPCPGNDISLIVSGISPSVEFYVYRRNAAGNWNQYSGPYHYNSATIPNPISGFGNSEELQIRAIITSGSCPGTYVKNFSVRTISLNDILVTPDFNACVQQSDGIHIEASLPNYLGPINWSGTGVSYENSNDYHGYVFTPSVAGIGVFPLTFTVCSGGLSKTIYATVIPCSTSIKPTCDDALTIFPQFSTAPLSYEWVWNSGAGLATSNATNLTVSSLGNYSGIVTLRCVFASPGNPSIEFPFFVGSNSNSSNLSGQTLPVSNNGVNINDYFFLGEYVINNGFSFNQDHIYIWPNLNGATGSLVLGSSSGQAFTITNNSNVQLHGIYGDNSSSESDWIKGGDMLVTQGCSLLSSKSIFHGGQDCLLMWHGITSQGDISFNECQVRDCFRGVMIPNDATSAIIDDCSFYNCYRGIDARSKIFSIVNSEFLWGYNGYARKGFNHPFINIAPQDFLYGYFGIKYVRTGLPTNQVPKIVTTDIHDYLYCIILNEDPGIAAKQFNIIETELLMRRCGILDIGKGSQSMVYIKGVKIIPSIAFLAQGITNQDYYYNQDWNLNPYTSYVPSFTSMLFPCIGLLACGNKNYIYSEKDLAIQGHPGLRFGSSSVSQYSLSAGITTDYYGIYGYGINQNFDLSGYKASLYSDYITTTGRTGAFFNSPTSLAIYGSVASLDGSKIQQTSTGIRTLGMVSLSVLNDATSEGSSIANCINGIDFGSTSQKLKISSTTFEDNNSSVVISGTNIDLSDIHCNTFKIPSLSNATGILIKSGASLEDNQIGQPYSPNSNPLLTTLPAGNQFPAIGSSATGCPYPASTWSNNCEVTSWIQPAGWISIENQSATRITYNRYFNEFVGDPTTMSFVSVTDGSYNLGGASPEATYLRVNPTQVLPTGSTPFVDACADVFSPPYFPITRIAPQRSPNALQISPNPSEGTFTLIVSEVLQEDDMVELFSPLASNPIQTLSIKKGASSIQLGRSGLMPGFYEVRLKRSGLSTRAIVH